MNMMQFEGSPRDNYMTHLQDLISDCGYVRDSNEYNFAWTVWEWFDDNTSAMNSALRELLVKYGTEISARSEADKATIESAWKVLDRIEVGE